MYEKGSQYYILQIHIGYISLGISIVTYLYWFRTCWSMCLVTSLLERIRHLFWSHTVIYIFFIIRACKYYVAMDAGLNTPGVFQYNFKKIMKDKCFSYLLFFLQVESLCGRYRPGHWAVFSSKRSSAVLLIRGVNSIEVWLRTNIWFSKAPVSKGKQIKYAKPLFKGFNISVKQQQKKKMEREAANHPALCKQRYKA